MRWGTLTTVVEWIMALHNLCFFADVILCLRWWDVHVLVHVQQLIQGLYFYKCPPAAHRYKSYFFISFLASIASIRFRPILDEAEEHIISAYAALQAR